MILIRFRRDGIELGTKLIICDWVHSLAKNYVIYMYVRLLVGSQFGILCMVIGPCSTSLVGYIALGCLLLMDYLFFDLVEELVVMKASLRR